MRPGLPEVAAAAMGVVATDQPANGAGEWGTMSFEGRPGARTQTLAIQQVGVSLRTAKEPRGGSPFEGPVTANKSSFSVKRAPELRGDAA
jgi:hypothetical protein